MFLSEIFFVSREAPVAAASAHVYYIIVRVAVINVSEFNIRKRRCAPNLCAFPLYERKKMCWSSVLLLHKTDWTVISKL